VNSGAQGAHVNETSSYSQSLKYRVLTGPGKPGKS